MISDRSTPRSPLSGAELSSGVGRVRSEDLVHDAFLMYDETVIVKRHGQVGVPRGGWSRTGIAG